MISSIRHPKNVSFLGNLVKKTCQYIEISSSASPRMFVNELRTIQNQRIIHLQHLISATDNTCSITGENLHSIMKGEDLHSMIRINNSGSNTNVNVTAQLLFQNGCDNTSIISNIGYQMMNRNARKPTKANHGSRPCSRISRRDKRGKSGNPRRK